MRGVVTGWLRRAVVACLLACTAPAAFAAPPARIADGWFAHNAVLVMLGASDKVVATVASPDVFPWMYRVAPGLRKAEFMRGPPMNVDALLGLRTDLAFVTPADPVADKMAGVGIRTLKVSFTDFPSMLACIDATAQALDTGMARDRAAAYRAYLAQTLATLAHAPAPGHPPPRVLHIVSFQPLRVDGADTIVDAWIRAAGGQNAATGLVGNQKPVSMEQVLAWQPDLIIVGDDLAGADKLPERSLWQQLAAVKAGHVYRNPRGVFPWDRYGPELALQVQWAADLIAHGKVDEGTLGRETQQFYKRFFDYPLSGAEALRILRAQPPADAGAPHG